MNNIIEIYNEQSINFIFNRRDLKVRISEVRNEFDVFSSQLRENLALVTREISPISRIIFLDADIFMVNSADSDHFWFKVKKSAIRENVRQDGSLFLSSNDFKYFMENELVQNTDYSDYSRLEEKAWKFKVNLREERLRAERLLSARNSATQEIDEEARKNNITHQELMIDYLFLLPDYCNCEIKPTGHPDNDSLYDKTH